ncbi:hypothetical protein ABI59_14100 [Acidobacteria bacterium Mor1]|nr:hypothetical protein ABI59_14100 [Acidobacteria bacterium Mor1]
MNEKKNRLDEALLNDYVDGLLDDAEREQLERQLADCESSRQEVEALKALRAEAAALPKEVAPGRDLFPEIRQALDSEMAARPTPRAAWIGLAAALLIVAGLSGWLLRGQWAPGADGGATAANGGAAGQDGPPQISLAADEGMDFAAIEQEYVRAAELLLESIEARSDQLAPETQAALRENLAIIDRAIEEIRAALAKDPGGEAQTEMLTAMYRQKLDLLWRVSRLSS